MGDRKEDTLSESATWDRMPAEVIRQVMKYLESPDLKSCRLLNKMTTSEANFYLFSTLRLSSDVVSFERATNILSHEDFALFVRRLKFQGPGTDDDQYLKRMVLDTQSLELTSISLVGLSLYETVYFFCYQEHQHQRAEFLSNATKLTLYFKHIEAATAADRLCTDLLAAEVSHVRCHLSGQLFSLQELEIGFSGMPIYHRPEFDMQKSVTNSLFSLTFANLRTLTLVNVAASADELLSVLKQRVKLRSLTLRDFYLGYKVEGEVRELGNMLRFIILLEKKLHLDHMSFQGELQVGNPEMFTVKCRQVGDPTDDGPATGQLRQNVEDFICHRGEFPFPSMKAYVRELLHDPEEKLECWSGSYWFDLGGGAQMYISPETDDTFELPRPHFMLVV